MTPETASRAHCAVSITIDDFGDRTRAIATMNWRDHRLVGVGHTRPAELLPDRALCPLAVVRGFEPTRTEPGAIVIEIDKTSDGDTVLQRAIDEALLRRAPLVALSLWQPHVTDVRVRHAVAVQNRDLPADLNRRLARAARRQPELDVRPVAVHGSLLNTFHTIDFRRNSSSSGCADRTGAPRCSAVAVMPPCRAPDARC